MKAHKPTLAVWKFASCDGCQLTLLDCEDVLLELADVIEIVYFLEASRATALGPYDLSLVEGSITTEADSKRIQNVRQSSKTVVTIGACATAGGIQALRNFSKIDDYKSIVYAKPEYIATLSTSTPISDHITVDFELHGCPINKTQLIEVITSYLKGKKPNVAQESVCVECKKQGNECVMVAHGTPCMGPITQAGCNAICPTYHRGCYGCYGPVISANVASLCAWWQDKLQVSDKAIMDSLRSFNAGAAPFRVVSEYYGKKGQNKEKDA